MTDSGGKVAFGWDTEEFFRRFELHEQIGIGGFATVHRGVDRLTKAPVAVKVHTLIPGLLRASLLCLSALCWSIHNRRSTKHNTCLPTAALRGRYTYFRR